MAQSSRPVCDSGMRAVRMFTLRAWIAEGRPKGEFQVPHRYERADKAHSTVEYSRLVESEKAYVEAGILAAPKPKRGKATQVKAAKAEEMPEWAQELQAQVALLLTK